MPTYEYRCPKGHDFEKFNRSISSAPEEVHCPECGALAVRQLSGGAGLVFKGSGFYITDYGKDGKKDQKKPAEKTESGSPASSDAAAAPPADAKPVAGSSESKPASTKQDAKPAAAPTTSKSKDKK